MTGALFTTDNGILRLQGSECGLCGYRWFPAAGFGCERCGAHGSDIHNVALSGNGRMIARATIPDGELSFLLATIALDAGPVVRGIVTTAGSNVPAVGDRLEAFVLTEGEHEVVRFRRVDGTDT